MPRFKAIIAYDGTHFSGYQVQPGKRTVQLELEEALKRMHKGEAHRVTASGRTDAGVHAFGQVIHFDSSLNVPAPNWVRALNSLLPKDILIRSVEDAADDFHARFDVQEKEYRFKILNRKEPDVFRQNYSVHVPDQLDLSQMREGAKWVIGTHDFTSFCAANTSVVDKVRTVSSLDICETHEDELEVRIAGNGFLYQMVRIVVGHLIAVGRGKAAPIEIKQILEAKDRTVGYPTAPPQGLYLWRVTY
ncbi:tRNA pseudouridine(38-40) synthase TruA [Pullulanibacillus sp. KACC 23026]|uniref:tRNA pseudouridine(38-40) synthase TruA n=1 Tax=Pullulanibacillus sp. KACC 23026 TaxID=3028315 RepID=UPI0023AED47B|nr:tRNA pseudouridine(38-40) synthase TruA [Pullulanibacillus sp. KACC 23026]WEG12641.1 tRNA pseudouridine(38-40) synthase TruA [Pullulanibacillus sp. KACC 23026]